MADLHDSKSCDTDGDQIAMCESLKFKSRSTVTMAS